MTDTTLHVLCKGFGALISRSKDPSFPEESARLNERGNLPLHAACSFQAPADVLDVLLKAYPGGASQPNAAGNLPIHQAVLWQAPLESVQLLLSRFPEGATFRNQYGSLPLHLAARHQTSTELIRLLIDAYPDALHLQNDDGMTPLDLAMAAENIHDEHSNATTMNGHSHHSNSTLGPAGGGGVISEVTLALLEGRPPPPELTRRQQAERFEERAQLLERKLVTLRENASSSSHMAATSGSSHDLRMALAAVRRLADRYPHALYAAKMDPNELEIAFSNAAASNSSNPQQQGGGHTAESILLEAVKKRGPSNNSSSSHSITTTPSSSEEVTLPRHFPPRDRVEDLLASVVGLEHVKALVRGLRRTAEISDLKESLVPSSASISLSTSQPSYGGGGTSAGSNSSLNAAAAARHYHWLLAPALAEDTGRPGAPHLVFCGNPGTGKTAVARLLAKALHELGVLRKPKFLEVERMDLVVPRDAGLTTIKTREVLDEARGGILLIDETYTLGVASKRKSVGGLGSPMMADTGLDAIAEIVQGIDNQVADDFPLIILAGFPLDTRAFLAFQPELRKRFPMVLEFPDYTCAELAKIFVDLATAKGFDLDENLTPAHIAQLLEKETTPAWRSERNGRITEMLLAGVRAEMRKRMRRAQLEEQEDFDSLLIVREDVETVMRMEFK